MTEPAIKSIAPEPPADNAPRRHPYLSFALRVGLGVAVVGFLIWHYDAGPIFSQLRHEKIGFFLATAMLYLIGQAVSAWRWQLLARIAGIRGRYREYFAYTYIGMFTNLFVPGLIGGDAARAVYLGRRHDLMGNAIASVVADRAAGLIGVFWLAAACAVAIGRAIFPDSVMFPTAAVGVASFAGWLAAPLIARLVSSIGGRAGSLLTPIIPYLRRPFALIPAIVLSVLLQVILASGQYLLALGLGLHISPVLFMACVPIANVFASLPITLNGLGVRETAYILLFGMAGVSRGSAIALGLLWFASTMIAGLTGVVAFVTTETPTLVRVREAAEAK
ncbi:MAG: lysylphosphatidylglycerol synthase transmembrane domain-containing protein [Candidatus Binataceae bacterium]